MVLLAACSTKPADSVPPAASARPADAQHAGITTPHGDHSPHLGGMVLMKDELEKIKEQVLNVL